MTRSERPTLEEWQQPLITHPNLDKLGYVWHPGIKLLFCLLCKTAVSPGSVERHCSSHESQRSIVKADKIVIDELLQGCQFGEREGRLPDLTSNTALPPITLFDTVYAFQCPACVKVYDDLLSIMTHFNKAHGSRIGQGFPRISAQYLFRGHYSVMFPVTIAIPAEGPGDSWQMLAIDLQTRMSNSLQDEYKADWAAKDAWPYLKDVSWHLVLEANIENFSIAELKMLVTIPAVHLRDSRGTLATHIALAVESWVLGLERDVRRSDYRLRQYVGSEEKE